MNTDNKRLSFNWTPLNVLRWSQFEKSKRVVFQQHYYIDRCFTAYNRRTSRFITIIWNCQWTSFMSLFLATFWRIICFRTFRDNLFSGLPVTVYGCYMFLVKLFFCTFTLLVFIAFYVIIKKDLLLLYNIYASLLLQIMLVWPVGH